MKKLANPKKLCITTYFDEKYSPLGELSLDTIRQYATRYGFDVALCNQIVSERPAPWNKILVIQELFSRDYDYVLWMDADALFVDSRESIADEIEEGKDLYLVKHTINSREVPNSGVFLIKNSTWSRDLLTSLWDKREYIHHTWWENAALMHVLGYHGLLRTDADDHLNQSLLDRIKWLGCEWNTLPGICESGHPIIKHYAGCSYDARLENMTLDNKTITARRTLRIK